MKPRHANAHRVRAARIDTGEPCASTPYGGGKQRSTALRRAAVTGSFVALFAVAAVGSAAGADEPHAGAATAAAQAAPGGMSPVEVEREAEAIARSIMSPFCPGRTVSACPNAGPWRDDIRKWVAEGVDALEIKRRLAERVPEHNLMGVPKNRLGWVLPVGLGIGALGSLIFLLRYLVGPKGPPGPGASAGKPGAGKSGAGKPAPAEPAASDDVDGEVAAGAPAARGKAAKGGAVPARANGEDWDKRLDDELETLEQ